MYVSKRSQIALNYVKGYFIFDLVSIFPFEEIVRATDVRHLLSGPGGKDSKAPSALHFLLVSPRPADPIELGAAGLDVTCALFFLPRTQNHSSGAQVLRVTRIIRLVRGPRTTKTPPLPRARCRRRSGE